MAAQRYELAWKPFQGFFKLSNLVVAARGGFLSLPKSVWRGDYTLLVTAKQELERVVARSPRHSAKARRMLRDIAKAIGDSRRVAARIARGELTPAEDFDAEAYLKELNAAFPESFSSADDSRA